MMYTSGNARSADAIYEKGRLYNTPLDGLLADPSQPRKVMETGPLRNSPLLSRSTGFWSPSSFGGTRTET